MIFSFRNNDFFGLISHLVFRRTLQKAKERAEREAAEKAAEAARLAEIEAEKKKKQKAEINATKKQRKIFRNFAKEKNYWVAESEQIAMMENVEFICQAFDSVKLAEINKDLTEKPGKTYK